VLPGRRTSPIAALIASAATTMTTGSTDPAPFTGRRCGAA
jgi:hypothetical protein